MCLMLYRMTVRCDKASTKQTGRCLPSHFSMASRRLSLISDIVPVVSLAALSAVVKEERGIYHFNEGGH